MKNFKKYVFYLILFSIFVYNFFNINLRYKSLSDEINQVKFINSKKIIYSNSQDILDNLEIINLMEKKKISNYETSLLKSMKTDEMQVFIIKNNYFIFDYYDVYLNYFEDEWRNIMILNLFILYDWFIIESKYGTN